MRNPISPFAAGMLAAIAGATPATAQLVQTVDFSLASPTNGIEDVAVADIDLDGDQDLICAYRVRPAATAASVVTIVYNNGSTTPFGPVPMTSTQVIVGTGATRIQIRVGELGSPPTTPPEIVVFSRNGLVGGGSIRVFLVLSSPSGAPNTFTVTNATLAAVPVAGFDDFVLSDYNYDNTLEIVAVVPGKMSIVGFAPPLDKFGNSVRAQKAIQYLAEQLDVSVFGSGR